MELNRFFVLLVLVLVLPCAYSQERKVMYIVSISESDSGWQADKVEAVTGYYSPEEESSFRFELLSFKGVVLERGFFPDPYGISRQFVPPEDGGAGTPPTEVRVSAGIRCPYHPNGMELKVYNGQDLLLTVDVSRFATCNEDSTCDAWESSCSDCGQETVSVLCGDGVCHASESASACPQDCGSSAVRPDQGSQGQGSDVQQDAVRQDKYCGNGICESGENFMNCPEDCSEKFEEEKRSGMRNLIILVIIMLVLGVLGFFFYMKIKGQPPQGGQEYQRAGQQGQEYQQYGQSQQYPQYPQYPPKDGQGQDDQQYSGDQYK
ncbi:hypothetical protein JW968_05190 [Candidatus Woesearchaeota archaeon]|nr:hypothetical protein [Candidatus Woesearchaeota archaeon]